MSVRTRLRASSVLASCLLLAAGLGAAPVQALTNAPEVSTAGSAPSSRLASGTPKAANRASATAGEIAGRRAGARAGANGGRAAGAAVGGAVGARAGEAAGRKVGAVEGAKAGRKAGAGKRARRSASRAGARAGARAGSTAGARAGRIAGTPSCGTTVFYKVDGSPWRCSFADDFNGTQLNPAKWRVMTSAQFDFGQRPDCFLNRSANVSVAGGVLSLVARRESSPFTCHRGQNTYTTDYSAGMVSTYQKWSQAYGRYEFRAKFPYTTQKGVQTSTWLWPADSSGTLWPITGEIDVAEWYSQWADRVIPYIHYANFLDSQVTSNTCLVAAVGNWHTYVLEWTPSGITIGYDGKTCITSTSAKGSPFDKPYLLAMFQGYGLGQNAPTASTPAVSRSQFAWVRAWS